MKEHQYIKLSFGIVLVLLLSTLIESAILSNIYFLPAIPDLSLICILFLSLYNGKLIGETSGFVVGLFLDFLSAGPFGFNMLYKVLFGYISGIFNKTINPEGFFISMLLGGCATIIKGILILIISFCFPMANIDFSPFTYVFLCEIAENMILTPLIFKLLRVFKKTLILRPENII